jgi:hypothetical protein
MIVREGRARRTWTVNQRFEIGAQLTSSGGELSKLCTNFFLRW